ncbi:MAG: hypothetical protein FJX78_05950 [Armatimonadetes bacterium]|nr:hypothetical protein [Armatimonadota bacterium]
MSAKTARPQGNPRGSGYPRATDDFYVEPPEAVHALFDAEHFRGHIYDPACGIGTIVKIARQRGYGAAGSDIEDRLGLSQSGVWFRQDFVTGSWGPRPVLASRDGYTVQLDENIVCNPPYGLAQEFILRALIVAQRKVAMLLRLSFLEGQERAKLFQSTRLARVHVFSYRISMPSGAALAAGTKPKGGSVAFAWFVWDRDHVGPPTINWLTRQ